MNCIDQQHQSTRCNTRLNCVADLIIRSPLQLKPISNVRENTKDHGSRSLSQTRQDVMGIENQNNFSKVNLFMP